MIKYKLKEDLDYHDENNEDDCMEIEDLSAEEMQTEKTNDNNIINSKKKNKKKRLKSKSITPIDDNFAEPPTKKRKISHQ